MRTRPRPKGDVVIGFVFIFISYRRNFLGHSVTFHVRKTLRSVRGIKISTPPVAPGADCRSRNIRS